MRHNEALPAMRQGRLLGLVDTCAAFGLATPAAHIPTPNRTGKLWTVPLPPSTYARRSRLSHRA
eukprot:1161408-Pelagomonas_calceolata.AAC.5